MKISFENSYWANAIGVIGVAFAISLTLRGCSKILIEMEKEKTTQMEIKYKYHHSELEDGKDSIK